MVFIRRVSVLFVFLFLRESVVFAESKTPEHIIYAYQIQKKFVEEMEQKYGFVCCGRGGSMPCKVNDIAVMFQLERRATIAEARALEVLAMERLCEMINADEKIRPYLSEFPFPVDRVQVALSFYSRLNFPFADGTITRIVQIKGKLYYRGQDPITGDLIPIFEEPYAEAKKIVETVPISDLLVHKEQPHEPIIDGIFLSYVKEMFKEYKLGCERIGGKLTDGVDEVGVSFIYFHSTYIEKARELQIIATERLLQAINSNEELRPYIKDYPLTLDKLKVRVAFRRKNYFPFLDGSIDNVCREGDKVIYYRPYETDEKGNQQRVRDPVFAKETYQEAVMKVNNTPAIKKCKVKEALMSQQANGAARR